LVNKRLLLVLYDTMWLANKRFWEWNKKEITYIDICCYQVVVLIFNTKNASFSHPGKGSLKNCWDNLRDLGKWWGAIRNAVMMTGTGGSVNNKDAEDVFNQEVLNITWLTDGTRQDLYSLSCRRGWESCGVPNIELAMMQLIHSRKALETDPIACAGTCSQSPVEGFYHWLKV
jgi:hypothetical protein